MYKPTYICRLCLFHGMHEVSVTTASWSLSCVEVVTLYSQNYRNYIYTFGACGSVVVRALRYKSAGPGIDSRR